MRLRLVTIVTLLWLFLNVARSAHAQTSCPAPPSDRDTGKGNIFTDQQEMDLGDAMAEQLQNNFRVVQDSQLNAYLDQIAQRLLAQLPPSQMKFRITLIDAPVVNAFTMPGGRIYISRTMVEFAQSEDELAGVLSHELGHAVTREPGATFSRIFRQVLGVTQVGDRADIFLKYNQFLDNVARKHLHFDSSESSEEQAVADEYGLYALVRAGYSPQAMASFWDRYAHVQGKTGNWLTDLFGATSSDEQRLRRMRETIPRMPPACIAAHPQTTAAFISWQKSVIAYVTPVGGAAVRESLPGMLWKRQLSPPLESEITNVRFSPDGKYVLAQDDFSVYVLSRNPLKPMFRIPVDNAEPATFTPDSQSVLIWTSELHVEKWSVASGQRSDWNDVVVPQPCIQTDVSPDGSVAACIQSDANLYTLHLGLSLFDVATGTSIITKPHFHDVNLLSPSSFLVAFLGLYGEYMAFSPDGRYFALSNASDAFAWDLKSRTPVRLSSSVRDVMSGGFTFAGPNVVVGINLRNLKKSGSVQFPSGPAGIAIPLHGQTLSAPAHGEGILTRTMGDNTVSLIDLKTGKSLLASQISALDVYDHSYARARPDGSVGIFDLDTRKEIAFTQLPNHWIGNLLTGSVSADLKWFAGSGRTRGALWSLTTGDRIFHVHGFRACGFSSQGTLYADFIPHEKNKRVMGILNPLTGSVQQAVDLPEDENLQVSQVGMYLLYGRSQKGKWNGPLDFEVRDIVTRTTLWTKHLLSGFPYVAMSPSSSVLSLMSPLAGDDAKQQRKADVAFAAESKGISDKNTARFIQVVNAQDGKLRTEFAVDTGNGSFAVRQALPAGNWVVVSDTDNRARVYSLDGKLEGSLFGTRPAVSDAGGYLALESQAGVLSIYDLATLQKREDLTFSVPLSFYQFVGDGSELFAVTADQTAYLLNVGQSKAN